MRRTLFAMVVLASACGAQPPLAPSTSNPAPASSLDAGAYMLTVSMSTSGNSGFSTCVSLTIGGTTPAFSAVFVPTPVHLERAGNNMTITPDDPSATFRMQLQIAGASLSGTASGQYRTSATPIVVSGRSSGTPAAVTGVVGSVSGPYSATGVIDGAVSVDSMTCTNNGHTWMLTAR